MKRFAYAAALTLFLPAAAGATHAVDGAWAGHFTSDPTSALILFVMKTDGATLTGTITGGGLSLSMQNGVLAGNSVLFDARPSSDPTAPNVFSCTGNLQDDTVTMTMTCTAEGQPDKVFTLKRQQVM